VPPFSRRTAAAADPAGEVLDQLIRSLQAEGDALIRGDLDKLGEAVHDKDRSVQRLAGELRRLDHSELRSAVRMARDLNDRNARLLAAHLNANRARMHALLGSAHSTALYSPDGHAAGAERRSARRGVRA